MRLPVGVTNLTGDRSGAIISQATLPANRSVWKDRRSGFLAAIHENFFARHTNLLRQFARSLPRMVADDFGTAASFES